MAIKISSLKAAEIIGIKHDDLLHYVNSVISQNKPITFIKRTSEYDMPAADAYRVAMATNHEACDRMAEYWDRELEEARNAKILANEQFESACDKDENLSDQMIKEIQFLCSCGGGETIGNIQRRYKDTFTKEAIMKICQWLTKNGKLKKIRKLRYKTIY